MMKKLLFFLVLGLCTNLFASTKFVWLQKKAGKLETGFCLEVDKKVDTNNFFEKSQFDFSKKVSSKKCKPADRDINYYFNPSKGKCFEGDSETGGKKYFLYTKLKNCKTEKTEFKRMNIGGRFACFEIDTKTNGADYYKKMKPSHCDTHKSRYAWVRNSVKSGVCYSFGEKGQKLKTKKELCRPDNPLYLFVRTGSLKGYCLEVSGDSSNLYSNSVKTKKCKPKETSFFFYKKAGDISGKCYEVDSATNGDNYLKLVDGKECK